MENSELTLKKLQEAFSSLKPNKSMGYDEISINVVKKIYDLIENPLCCIFILSLKRDIFH